MGTRERWRDGGSLRTGHMWAALVFEEDHVCDDCRSYGPQTGHPDVEPVGYADYYLEHTKLALEQPNVRLWDDEKD